MRCATFRESVVPKERDFVLKIQSIHLIENIDLLLQSIFR